MPETKQPYAVEPEGARATFEKWLERGDSIGVFENRAMDSASCGHRLYFPLTALEQTTLKIGSAKAPDGPWGLGWKYLLGAVEDSLDSFLFLDGQVMLMLGAEGCAESEGQDWIREPEEGDREKFLAVLGLEGVGHLESDRIGRPYFLRVLSPSAPPEILERARQCSRMLRLEP